MIGLGKWKFSVNTVLLKGEAIINIMNKNGEYAFSADIPGLKEMPDYYIDEVKVNGDTLNIKGGTPLLPGKVIEVSATFKGDTCEGYINAPFIGKLLIKDGKKVG
jgi:hypothetical protein